MARSVQSPSLRIAECARAGFLVPDRSAGFTLIEMLAVLSIMALLMTLAWPRYHGALERSKETVLRQNLQVIRSQIDRFNADQGRYPDTLEELVDRQYLRAVPSDPIAEPGVGWVLVPPRDASRGVFDVRSAAEGKTQAGVPYATL